MALERWYVSVAERGEAPRQGQRRSPASLGDVLYQRAYPAIEGLADLSEPLPFLLLSGNSITQSVPAEVIRRELVSRGFPESTSIQAICVTTKGQVFWSEPLPLGAAAGVKDSAS